MDWSDPSNRGTTPPLAGGVPVFGVLRAFRRTPLACLQRAALRGPLVRLCDWPRMYFVNDPDAIRYILQTNQRNYRRIVPSRRSAAILGESLPLINDDQWLQRRRLMQPAFHRERIALLVDTITATTATLLATLAPDRPVDIRAAMSQLTQTMIVKAMFGYDIGSALELTGAALRSTVAYLEQRSGSLLDIDAYVPTGRRRAYQRSRQALDDFIAGLIAERRAGQGERADLLTLLLNAHDADTGTVLSDTQVRDELIMIYLAGHETTATALTWACYLLARHEAVARVLMQEVDTVLHGRTPSIDDLAALRFSRAVIDETMRLYPPVWMLLRQARLADRVSGYSIPANSNMVISPFISHRDARHWSQPEVFAPQRFIEDPHASRSKGYVPFGAGPRQCIGNTLALASAQIMLVMIVQRFGIKFAQELEQEVTPTAGFTLVPSVPIWLYLLPRN